MSVVDYVMQWNFVIRCLGNTNRLRLLFAVSASIHTFETYMNVVGRICNEVELRYKVLG